MSHAGAPPKDSRGTLNLPSTPVSSRAEPGTEEPRVLAKWSELSLGTRMRELRSGAEPFVLAARPLEARGPLHMGQALSAVLADIVRKYRHLSGRRCELRLGWDADSSFSEVLETPHDDLQRREAVLRRLGVVLSGESMYRTVDPAYEAQELRELASLARRGLLSRRKQPVLWCPKEQTGLGEHEVVDAPRLSSSAYVAFRAGPEVAERFSSLKGRQVFFLTWTLAPWSLPGNVALSVNADFEYVFYEAGERVLCVAKDLLAKVLAEVKADELVMKNARLPGGDVETVAFDDLRKILVYASGEDLAGLRYQHPFLERTGQVVLGGPSALEEGTGLVHVAPGLGQGDAEVDPKLRLELYNPVDWDGRYVAAVGAPLQGLKVFEADPVILDLLEERGALLSAKKDAEERSWPHCRRCHHPVLRVASSQWFITLDAPLPGGKTLRERAMEEADRVRWVSGSGPHGLRSVLEKRADGCISRQRSSGVPLPSASCEGCGEVVVSPELMERVAAAVEKAGSDVWLRTPVEEFLGSDFRCASCGGSRFRRETDTLDPQFDAACMFPAVLGPKQGLPADLCVAEREQLDGWLASAMVVSVGTRDASPYRACFTHGSGVDAHGQKLSRSQDPDADAERFVARFGAEVLRLWAAFSDLQSDVPVSDAIGEALSQDLAKLRHTLAFALGHLADFEPVRDAVPASQLLPLDAWARGRLSEAVARARGAYETLELHRVYSEVMAFCSAELSATYFALIEDRLLTAKASARERRSAQTVLFEVASSLSRLLAPILSFTAEEVWQQLPGRPVESVFLTELPPPVGPLDPELAERYSRLLAVRGAVRPLIEETRRDAQLDSSLGARVVLAATGEARAFLFAHIDELPTLFRVSQVELVEEPGPKARPLALAQAWPGAELAAEVLPAWGAKCPRCGGFSEEVAQGSEVCPRCSSALR
jgi:isoleucyl-tRNA synthetase